MNQCTLKILAGCLMLVTASAWSQPATRGPGMGSGMMNGPGSGMMGGYGMGQGMMGGDGYSHGMMGGWMPNVSNLTEEQREKITAAQKDFQKKQWSLMEKMREDGANNSFYRGGKFDEQAARKAYDVREKLHRQMFENSLDMHKRIDSILTSQQREQLQQAWGR